MGNGLIGADKPEAEGIAGAKLGKPVKFGIQNGCDFRITAGRLVIGQKYGRHPIARHLNRALGNRL